MIRVFFDIETTGLVPTEHEIVQIAAIAVDSRWQERERFEVKLSFDEAAADPVALERNCYDPAVWQTEAVEATHGIGAFGQFLRRHRSIELTSKRGKPYTVAITAGHNIAGFDLPFVQHAFKSRSLFLPAAWFGLDTLQLANWWVSHLPPQARRPRDLKLVTLAEFFGLPAYDAHDALADVEANVSVARHLIDVTGIASS